MQALAASVQVRAQATESATRLLCIALLGAFAFYVLWEAKPRYSYPFLLWFSLLLLPALPVLSCALDGVLSFATTKENVRSLSGAQGLRRVGFVVMAATLALFLLNVRPMTQTLRFYKDVSTQQITARQKHSVPVTQAAALRQTFRADRLFNEIQIALLKEDTAKPTDVYEIVFDSTQKDFSFRHTFAVADIAEGMLRVVVDTVVPKPDTVYSIAIAPVTPGAQGLRWPVHQFADLYRDGALYANGIEVQNADAVFGALSISPRPLTTPTVFYAMLALCLLLQLVAFTECFHRPNYFGCLRDRLRRRR